MAKLEVESTPSLAPELLQQEEFNKLYKEIVDFLLYNPPPYASHAADFIELAIEQIFYFEERDFTAFAHTIESIANNSKTQHSKGRQIVENNDESDERAENRAYIFLHILTTLLYDHSRLANNFRSKLLARDPNYIANAIVATREMMRKIASMRASTKIDSFDPEEDSISLAKDTEGLTYNEIKARAITTINNPDITNDDKFTMIREALIHIARFEPVGASDLSSLLMMMILHERTHSGEIGEDKVNYVIVKAHPVLSQLLNQYGPSGYLKILQIATNLDYALQQPPEDEFEEG